MNVRELDNLITKLLIWLLDERVPRMDDGIQLPKALNVVVLKILVRFLAFELLFTYFHFFSFVVLY